MLSVTFKPPPDKQLSLEKDGLPEGYFTQGDIAAYRELAARVPDAGVIVEIGVYKGRSLCAIGPACKARGIHIWAVDPWRDIDPIMHEFLANTRHFKLEDIVMPLRAFSFPLAHFVPKQSLDLVFIDGTHDYDNVFHDIDAWTPRIKPGGWIAGHDYDISGGQWPDVKRAVHERFGDRSHALRPDSSVWAHQL